MGEKKLIADLSKIVEDHGFFVVEIRTNTQGKIRIFMDSLIGKVTIDDCVAVSQAILKSNEEIAEKYGIEVSSSGLDHPFRVIEQYQKNIGNQVAVLLKEGKKIIGKLTKVESEQIFLEETIIKKEKKKKMEVKNNYTFSFEQIKSTKQII